MCLRYQVSLSCIRNDESRGDVVITRVLGQSICKIELCRLAVIQLKVRHDPAQAPILFLQVLAAPDLGTPHAAIQLAPSVVALVTDSKTAASLLRPHATADLDLDRP